MYADDNNDWLASPPKPKGGTGDITWSSAEGNLMWFTSSISTSKADYGPNGWMLLAQNGYLGGQYKLTGTDTRIIPITICPSMDMADYRITHYDYRFNGAGLYVSESPYHQPRLTDNYWNGRLLFTDSPTFRRKSSNFNPPLTKSASNFAGSNSLGGRWAHQQGGNVMRFDGSGLFVRNNVISDDSTTSFPSTNQPKFANIVSGVETGIDRLGK